MSKEQIISAIDIGTTKIVAIICRQNEDGKFDVLGLGQAPSSGVKRGVVVHIDDTTKAIETARKQAETQANVKMQEVYVGVAGQHIKSMKNRNHKYIDSGEISQADVDYLTDQMHKTPVDPGEEILHVIPQSYIVDQEEDVPRPVGMSGRMLESNFHLVIGKVASANNIKKCVTRAGLEIKKLILEPLASSAAVLTPDEIEAGVALVDIGGGTTDVAVFHDKVVWHTAVIPFGGNVITNDIKEGCSILQRHAEALKTQFGSTMGDTAPAEKVVTIPGISGRDPREISFKNLAYIIQARMDEILDAVMFEIENSGYQDKLSAGLVITGGGSMLKDLKQLIKFKTGYDVRIGHPNRMMVPDIADEVNHPKYATSIGLSIKGVETGTTQAKTFFGTTNIGASLGLGKKVKATWTKFFSEEGDTFNKTV
ncbi:MAG: cell division protein FtsA [Bacteroidetes bacterium]|jgi:cell division protein FtsA|nr:cell division protein FtsA [Bacteroidota bacterium]MBT3749170.1 cell division protein FtsA [Bacteroidota bacterium]MBT4398492.1 cell division protein FtsA [Bacteroidota bacterium]MBT4409213.1 cell division protein FtsA [Bacteroidota bacterium]MBT5426222.1 cell division protein FtsA [Bacteroidota bacterium]